MSDHLNTINKLSRMAGALATEIIDYITDPNASVNNSNTESEIDETGNFNDCPVEVDVVNELQDSTSADDSGEKVNVDTPPPAGSGRRKVNNVPKKILIGSAKRQVAIANFNTLKAASITLKLESAIIDKQDMLFSKELTDKQIKMLELQIQKLRQLLKKQKRYFSEFKELNEFFNKN